MDGRVFALRCTGISSEKRSIQVVSVRWSRCGSRRGLRRNTRQPVLVQGETAELLRPHRSRRSTIPWWPPNCPRRRRYLRPHRGPFKEFLSHRLSRQESAALEARVCATESNVSGNAIDLHGSIPSLLSVLFRGDGCRSHGSRWPSKRYSNAERS